MAEPNYLGVFVTVITFLGVFVLLVMWIPPELYEASDMREVNVPDAFDISDIEFYETTWSHYLNDSGVTYGFGPYTYPDYWQLEVGGGTFGGWDIDWGYSKANKSHHNFYSVHRHTEWWGVIGADHLQEFLYEGLSRGNELTAEEIDSDRQGANFAKYRAECDHFSYYLYLGYNTTKYDNATDAWNHEEILAVAAIQFEDMNTGMSAWSVISALLWFDLPDTHWMINALIAIPLYASIIIVSFILVMKVIEALPFT